MSDLANWKWLVDAARQRHPEIALSPDIRIAPDLGDAWNQLASVFGISPADLAIEVARAHGLQKGHLASFQSGDGSFLPEAVYLLSGFAADALALPSACCSARLLEDRVELFYTKLPRDHFSIVGRRGEEAWAFVDGTPTPLRRVPAH